MFWMHWKVFCNLCPMHHFCYPCLSVHMRVMPQDTDTFIHFPSVCLWSLQRSSNDKGFLIKKKKKSIAFSENRHCSYPFISFTFRRYRTKSIVQTFQKQYSKKRWKKTKVSKINKKMSLQQHSVQNKRKIYCW